MKFTEGMFKFPVKVYDTFALLKNIKEEQDNFENLDRPLADDWVEGWMTMPIGEIKGYVEAFSPELKTGEVAKKGFDLTLVYTVSFGQLESTWKLERFEKELNSYAERYEKGIEALVENVFKEKELQVEREIAKNNKRRWWNRL